MLLHIRFSSPIRSTTASMISEPLQAAPTRQETAVINERTGLDMAAPTTIKNPNLHSVPSPPPPTTAVITTVAAAAGNQTPPRAAADHQSPAPIRQYTPSCHPYNHTDRTRLTKPRKPTQAAARTGGKTGDRGYWTGGGGDEEQKKKEPCLPFDGMTWAF